MEAPSQQDGHAKVRVSILKRSKGQKGRKTEKA
jgi:hypothetical protein